MKEETKNRIFEAFFNFSFQFIIIMLFGIYWSLGFPFSVIPFMLAFFTMNRFWKWKRFEDTKTVQFRDANWHMNENGEWVYDMMSENTSLRTSEEERDT
jgi:hypothetical protein